ncbi:MAG: lycopene cyclase domain-containing protein [Bacteroidia bacterium]|nr:lycopene cyclase domain-containing protein [Bacteroidia bacterium]
MTLTYLLLNISTLGMTLALSFDKRVAFFRQWRALFPAIVIVGAGFILWDILFTRMGVWAFNTDFTLGLPIWGLPLEEWMFFVTVPYACVFVYACLKVYISKDYLKPISSAISYGVLIISLIVGIIHLGKWYTSTTFLVLAILMSANIWIIKPSYIGRFYVSYMVSLIPFLIVNGILTALPVVIYNDLENLGLRIGTIPVEDTAYGFILQLANVNIFEYLLSRSGTHSRTKVVTSSKISD